MWITTQGLIYVCLAIAFTAAVFTTLGLIVLRHSGDQCQQRRCNSDRPSA
jgi:hypothetical protein